MEEKLHVICVKVLLDTDIRISSKDWIRLGTNH